MVSLGDMRLLLPALLPSWRFFDAVTASPRLDYALLSDPAAVAGPWREFRPRPAVLTPGAMLRRLWWNASWNEDLFLVSLAERLLHAATAETAGHSQREILLRVARHLHRHAQVGGEAWLQVRLRLVGAAHGTIVGEVVYLSSPCLMAGLLTP